MDNVSEQDATQETQPQPFELFHVGAAAEAFYGATQWQLSSGSGRDTELVLNATSEPVVVGSGEDEQVALADAMQRMHEQESAQTRRGLVEIAMSETTSVSLTTLEDYKPHIAPGSPAHLLPDYVQEMLRTRPHEVPETYEHTVAQEGWQTATRSVVSAYLSRTDEGHVLAATLGIRSLDHLTPAQAVQLSTTVVRSLSRYSLADAGRADQATTAELLIEGLQRRGDASWTGNGVCRNIAANVKAVFEALRDTQAEPSMLNNTYCVCDSGGGGAGYADKRQDPGRLSMNIEAGHAWNTFITVDSHGSSAITKVDATWALGEPVESVLRDLDQTDRRSVALTTQLLRRSERKADAFPEVSDYLRGLIDKSRRSAGRRTATETDFQEYVATEWLRLAGSDRGLQQAELFAGTLSTFMDIANRMSGRLDRSEIATLYTLDTANSSMEQERLKHVIRHYDTHPAVHTSGQQAGERLIFDNTALQRLAYDALGEARIMALAEQSGAFRARLRELEPSLLPPFDPDHSPADLEELINIASSHNIHSRLPSAIMSAFDRKLRAACPDQQTYQGIIEHNRGYRLASNFKTIMRRLQSSNTPH